MPKPTGLSEARVIEALVQVEAAAEANNVPTAKRDAMLAKARKDLTEKP